jgi:hypothetical protein
MSPLFDPSVFDDSNLGFGSSIRVADIIRRTLRLIGSLAKSEVPSADEQSDVLYYLQAMMDSWRADRLTIFNVQTLIFPLVSGQQVYTIGPGAQFNTLRPLWIDLAGIISNTNPVQPLELPVRILNDQEWSAISIKSVQSSLAWYLYYDYAFTGGWGNIKLWPIPNTATTQLALYIPVPLTSFVTPQDVFALPPGWEEAVRYNLAVRLCPEWGRPVDPVVAKIAMDSYAMICRANKRIQLLDMDPALLGNGEGIFNWITGQPGTRA